MAAICDAVQLCDDLLLVDFIRIKRAAIPIEFPHFRPKTLER